MPSVQGLEHLIAVRGVAGFHGAFHQNAGEVGDAEGPVVGDLLRTAPCSAITLVSCDRPPGRSPMKAWNRTRRPSCTRPKSMTRPSMPGSMFPPQRGTTTRLPRSSGKRSSKSAANLVAPAPSTTALVSSASRKIDMAMASSSTCTT